MDPLNTEESIQHYIKGHDDQYGVLPEDNSFTLGGTLLNESSHMSSDEITQ